MLPAFQINNFKTWTPPSRNSCPSSNHSHLHPPSKKSPAPQLHQAPAPSALPLPKHQLPARPPAEVCVHASAVTPIVTSRGCQSPSQRSSRLHSNTTPNTSLDTQHAGRQEQPLGNGAGPLPNSDLATSHNAHDTSDVSVDAPFLTEYTPRCASSPSVTSSDESWQDLPQPADEESRFPIDPAILTNNGPWAIEDENQHIHAAGHVDRSETSCQYPDPPPLLRELPAQYRHFNTYKEQEESSRSNNPLPNRSCAQASANDNNPEAHIHTSSNHLDVLSSGPQSKSRKRKSQESHGPPQQCKRVRKSSAIASTENSLSSLRSNFTSVSVDERLQFLSWLFEAALPRCISQSDSEAPERIAQPARHVAQSTDSAEPHGNSRKGMPYSSEERDLLLRLRGEEKRTWPEVTRMFSDQFPGRSQGSIQVFWSLKLKNRAH
ncbi:hypothetical protein ASPSYDRAFT_165028 [Aspergillus sydowii CBS 593.65]|uniref:Myb-like domain-containing protein n=1 Tax=Aspergillus sydowii CBS 593.65 TaxID=1036612 RepID=A0A1L9SYR4_9EURO|nr:uncharacterized protein ASPSYDRAFT_165028 [Aspergillus sydowii CBS 593.65]OJJ52173.1 hypothetical protein ASPSYDRAFT_165028 [Aspergillus sydowii CBS 593.65]